MSDSKRLWSSDGSDERAQRSPADSSAARARLRSGILPVLDLMDGHVVRGVAGRRDDYRPIISRLCVDSAPIIVARALRACYGFQRFYVADLGAIIHQQPHAEELKQLQDDGFELVLDAGVRSQKDLSGLGPFRGAGQIVLGLESLESPGELARIVDSSGPDHLVFSLDLKSGRPMGAENWPQEPLEIAELVLDAGLRRLILLDLSAVGMDGGLTTTVLCRRLRELHPDAELIIGGGVRSAGDLEAAMNAGANQVLVASALHDGRLDGLWQGARESTQRL